MNIPIDESRMTREDPAALHQYPLLTIWNGPVSIAYSGLTHTKTGDNGEDDQRRTRRTSGKWTNEVIEGRSGPAAIIGGEPLGPPMIPRRRHQDEGHGRTVRPTLRQGGTREQYEEESWHREDYWREEENRYHDKYRDIEEESQSPTPGLDTKKGKMTTEYAIG